MGHAGEEAGVVLRGAMDVVVGSQRHRLEEGDGIWFVSSQPHSFYAIGDSECVSIWADTLPDHALERSEMESLFGDPRPENLVPDRAVVRRSGE